MSTLLHETCLALDPDFGLPPQLRIPAGITLETLNVMIGSHGLITYDWRVIQTLAQHNGLARGHFNDLQAAIVGELIPVWYHVMRAEGWPPDPTLEWLTQHCEDTRRVALGKGGAQIESRQAHEADLRRARAHRLI